MTPETGARLRVLVGAALFSTAGAAIKACAFDGWQTAGLRSLVAGLAVLVLMPEARRAWSWRILPVAVVYAATLVLFVLANKLTTAAGTIFLQNVSPLYVIVLGWLFLRERLHAGDLWFIGALAAGMSLFFVDLPAPAETAPRPLLGNLLAAGSGLTMAGTLVGLRWLSRGTHAAGLSGTAVLAGNFLVVVVCLPFFTPWPDPAWFDWALVGFLGVFQLGLAYVLVSRALPHLPAFEVSLLILLEPVLNPVWTWLAHGEQPGSLALVGGGVILLATIIRTLRKSRMARLAPQGSSAS